MWVPHGQKADHNKWRFDVAQKSFIPPGTPAGTKGTQVEMPLNYQGNEPTGFHMVASPAGTQAPIEHINYTPETGEVSGRGQAAPPHMLNYTLMPEEAMQPQGAGSMGAGASVPSTSAFGAPSFAGTPPLANSPTMTGPSPTTNAAAPRWGGGGTPFDTRMGMGHMGAGDDVFINDDPSQPGGTTQPAPAPAPAQGGAPAAPAPAPATTTPANIIAPPQRGYPDGVPRGTPKKDDGTYPYPGEAIPIQGTVGVIGYRIYDSLDEFHQPKWIHSNGPANASEKDRYQTFDNNDGTVTVVDYSQNPPTVTKRGSQDPGVADKLRADTENRRLANEKLQLEIQAQQATSETDRQQAVLKLRELQLQIDKAGSDAAKAAVEAGMAGKPVPKAPDTTITDRSGQVYNLNSDTGIYQPTGVYQAAGTWKEHDDPTTQTHKLYNPETGEDVILSPYDVYKEYPPQKSTDGSGKWIQWDPGTKTYKTVYQETPDSTTQWSGDELIKVDKGTGAVTPIWTKKQTVAEKDAHEAAIDAHNTALQSLEKTKQDLVTGRVTAAQARVTMEKDLQDILHPKPIFSAQGDVFAPPGLTLNLQDWNPITGERGTRTLSGGPVDPRVDKMMAEMDAYMAGTGPAPTTTKPEPAKAPFDTSTSDQPQPTQSSVVSKGRQTGDAATPGVRDTGSDSSVGGQMGGQDIRPGYPGWDPAHLGGQAQPPTTRTTSSGDIAHYDENGILTGIDYRNTAPPGYVEGQGDNNEYLNPGMGGGHSMGAGMASGGGGWAPRPGLVAPATGPGFLGAGAEEQEFYDEQGNPMDLGAGAATSAPEDTNAVLAAINKILGTTSMPLPTPGGHAPPINVPTPNFPHGPQGEVKPPGPDINVLPKPGKGVTDEGAQWNPDLKGIVTTKVNEPLKKLLGWPKLEEQPPSPDPLIGTQGGFDQPEVDPYDTKKKMPLGPREPTDVGKKNPNVKDISHILGEGGTGPEDWADLEAEGMASGAGKNVDPEAAAEMERQRQLLGTTGAGAEPGDTMGAPGTPPSAQVPPQGPGGEQPPQWLLTLLQAHPELLQMAGLPGAPAGGAPPSSPPPTGAAGAPTQPAGSAPPAGWTPPDQGGAPSPPSGAPPGAPVAPSPEGAPMTPPLDPSDVAGIGHRYGQDMNVGEPQHSGVDLQAPEGTPTKSPVDGFVTRVENNPDGLGNTVVIQGMDGSEHRLGHLQSVTAYPGQQVKMGQDLGSPVGETGMTTGAHLHWGVRDQQGKPADPTPALGPMAQMPPVPGTQMMGPPGGVGGQAQQGAPQMGGGQERAGWSPRVGAGASNQMFNPLGATSDIGNRQESQARTMSVGQSMTDYTTPAGGHGAMPQPQRSPFPQQGAPQQGGQQGQGLPAQAGTAQSFAQAGAMPMRSQQPQEQQPQQGQPSMGGGHSMGAGGPGPTGPMSDAEAAQADALGGSKWDDPRYADWAIAQQARRQQPMTDEEAAHADTLGGSKWDDPKYVDYRKSRGDLPFGAGAAPAPFAPPTVPPQGPGWQPNNIPPTPPMPTPPPMPQNQGIQAGAIGQQMSGSMQPKGGPIPGGGGPRTSQPAPQGEQNPALAQPGMGGGQEKGKRKRKKAGWRPRYGAGQNPPVQPMQGQQPPMGGDAQSMMQQLLQQQFQQMMAQNRQPQPQPQPQPQMAGAVR